MPQVNDAKPLRDTDLGRVRSVDGVAWAVNASWGPEWFKLNFVKLPATAVIAK